MQKDQEKIKVKVCEWDMCMEKATAVEPYKGRLFSLCKTHKKLIKKQKKVDNNL